MNKGQNYSKLCEFILSCNGIPATFCLARQDKVCETYPWSYTVLYNHVQVEEKDLAVLRGREGCY